MKDINSTWAKSISRYPERFGALSGIFKLLLEEVEFRNSLPDDRIQYYRERFRAISSD